MRHALIRTALATIAVLGLLGAGCAPSPQEPPSAPPAGTPPGAPTSIWTPGQEILGFWQTDCLIPEPDDDWSERFTFQFNADGSAVYTRDVGYDHSCSGDRDVITYRHLVPKEGQIDLYATELGMTMYDIYATDGATLRFGHGFRNNFPYSPELGDTPATRESTLNNWIVYRR